LKSSGTTSANRAERDEVEPLRGARLDARGQCTFAPHALRERGHDVERDTDARECLRCEAIAGRVRIDDARRVGELATGQVVVRDEHVDAEAPCLGDAIDRRDTVVDGDDETRFTLGATRTISGVSP
jgi:hypothetical protein